MNYRTNVVNFFFGGGGGTYWGGALISKILLFRGALFREGRLSESGRSSDHLQYFIRNNFFGMIAQLLGLALSNIQLYFKFLTWRLAPYYP